MADAKKRTVRVQLYNTENDDYNELWKVVGTKHKFYCRHVSGGGERSTWYYVCDPLGYCELDSPANNIIFTVCDSNGKALFKSSNDDEKGFPTFKETMRAKWEEIRDSIPHFTKPAASSDYQSFREWLVSFKDPAKYKKEIDDMYGYDENWIYCRNELTKVEPVKDSQFEYLGTKYQFCWLHLKHMVCGKEYKDLYCCLDPVTYYDYEPKSPVTFDWLAYDFDPNDKGSVYAESHAARLIADELKSHFGSEEAYTESVDSFRYFCWNKKKMTSIAYSILPIVERKRDLSIAAVNNVLDEIKNGAYDDKIKLERPNRDIRYVG